MLPVSLLLAHFVGDFLLQSNWMAMGKSTRWRPLVAHVAIYSLCFLPWGWQFAAVTFGLHLATDYVTSRVNARLWFIALTASGETGPVIREAKRMDPSSGFRQLVGTDSAVYHEPLWFYRDTGTRHWFFVAIGADQLIHAATLAWTLKFLG